jgi:hypothetical protein
MEAPNKNMPETAKSTVKSGTSRETFVKTLGGEPPEKDVKEIDKVNSPVGRGKPPGSVRV